MARKNECGTKVKHRSESAATRAAFRFERRHNGEIMKAYTCRFCGWWHIGHPPEQSSEEG